MLLLNTPFSYMKTLSYDSRKDMNIKKKTQIEQAVHCTRTFSDEFLI